MVFFNYNHFIIDQRIPYELLKLAPKSKTFSLLILTKNFRLRIWSSVNKKDRIV